MANPNDHLAYWLHPDRCFHRAIGLDATNPQLSSELQQGSHAGLVAGSAERGFDGEALKSVRLLVDADDCDLFDVLNYIAHTKAPLKRAERAGKHWANIMSRYDTEQQAFLEFVLSQYVAEGEEEFETDKLPNLLGLKYGSPSDAVRELGSVSEIRSTFTGFQRRLYEK